MDKNNKSKLILFQADKLEGDETTAFDKKFIQDELNVIQKKTKESKKLI